MKIQFYGQNCFFLKGTDASCVFDPQENFNKTINFATNSGTAQTKNCETGKILDLPGEFEISGILVKGFFSDNQKNVVYKIIMDNLSLVHFGSMKDIPDTKFFENIGENIDIIFINLSENFDEKKAKELIEKIEPRMVFLGGDVSFFPKMVEKCAAKITEGNPISVSKSSLSDDKTEILILNA